MFSIFATGRLLFVMLVTALPIMVGGIGAPQDLCATADRRSAVGSKW